MCDACMYACAHTSTTPGILLVRLNNCTQADTYSLKQNTVKRAYMRLNFAVARYAHTDTHTTHINTHTRTHTHTINYRTPTYGVDINRV